MEVTKYIAVSLLQLFEILPINVHPNFVSTETNLQSTALCPAIHKLPITPAPISTCIGPLELRSLKVIFWLTTYLMTVLNTYAPRQSPIPYALRRILSFVGNKSRSWTVKARSLIINNSFLFG